MYSGYNIRDFGQLIQNLYSQLQYLTCEQEKADKTQLQIIVCRL